MSDEIKNINNETPAPDQPSVASTPSYDKIYNNTPADRPVQPQMGQTTAPSEQYRPSEPQRTPGNGIPNYQQTTNPYYNSVHNQEHYQNGYNTNYYSSQAGNGNPTGSMYSYPANSYGYSAPAPQKVKKEKKKSGAGLVAACLIISIICGLGGGFGGSFVFNKYFVKDNGGSSDDNTTVIYQSVDNDKNNSSDSKNDGSSGNSSVIYESVDREVPEKVTNAGTVAIVAEIALPSVVEIRTEAVVNNSFYGQYVTEGAGSGVIISNDGYIVTNNHVVSGSSNITVRLTNGEEYKATLIGTDAQSDIAVIKIEAKDLAPAVFGNSENLVVGELTVAIGNPLGELGGTVTDGIVSALDREITVEGENMILLQTNAAVSPGNSGGGLFNSKGELIGIVNAKTSGSSVEGLGFAIPVNTAKPIIKDLIEKGHVTGRPSIGVTIIEVTTDYQRYMYGVNDYGVYIQKALNEEFKSGDRIIAIDGNSVSTSSDIKSIISGHNVGDKITVTVSRKNKIVDVQVTLIDSAENTLTTE